MDDRCLFCRLADGEIPADVVHETPRTLAFRDISPQAPVHVLVIPKAHHANLGALALADPQLASELLQAVQQTAEQEGLDHYRVVFNTGSDAGQSVFHVHGHVMGGRPMGWPPG